MKKTVLTFGLISGAIVSVLMVLSLPLEDALSHSGGAYVVGYATMVAAFMLIFFGIRSYRDNVGGGRVGFGRALAIGALIALISSVCYTATWEVIYFGFKSDFAEKYQASQIERVRKSGAPPAEIEKKRQEMEKFVVMYHNPAINVAMTMMEPLPVGLVIALVSAGILSRRRKNGALASVPA